MRFFVCVRTKDTIYAETSWRSLRDKYLLSGCLDLVESLNGESETFKREIRL